jgi:choline dehydrogenase-like flavoprotein
MSFAHEAFAARPGNTTDCDVLVLGAGLAGTSAAWRLVGERPAHAPLPRVCIIEASEHIGGRTRDHDIEGCHRPQTVELGAQWIAQQEVDSAVWDLAVNVLNLGVYNGWPWALYGFPVGPAGRDAETEAWLDRVPSASSAAYNAGRDFFGPNVSASDPQAGKCKDEVAHVYDSVVMGAPWRTEGAAALDLLTPLEWLAHA